jgi:hypothetical protein
VSISVSLLAVSVFWEVNGMEVLHRRIGCVGAAAVASLLLASPVSAMPITYGSFTGTVINFDDLAGAPDLGTGEVLGAQYAASGVTFDVPNYAAYANNGSLATMTLLNSDPNVIWVDQGGGMGDAPAVGMNIDFSSPQSKIGLFMEGSVGSTFTLQVFSGATLLETLTSGLAPSGVGAEGFLALENLNITRAVVYSTNSNGKNWNFSIDDLKFAAVTPVPDPGSTLLLFSMGLVGLRAGRKRWP